jgi:hypothetical protein
MMTLSGERLARERVISDIQLKKLDDSDLLQHLALLALSTARPSGRLM